MKINVLLAACFLTLSGCSEKNDSMVDVTLLKSGPVYEVYEGGELILEFTPRNCDSLELDLLKDIFEEAQWHRSLNPRDPKTGSSNFITREGNIGSRSGYRQSGMQRN